MDVRAPATLVATAAAALGACAVCAVSSGTGGGRASSVQSRVALEGNVNCRSLGGYPGLGGRTVRVGRLYRSDTLRKLTEADISLLNSLGLKTQLNMEGAVGTSLGKADESTGARAVQPAWREVPINVEPVERSPDGLGPDFVVSSENLIGAAKSCATTNSAQAMVDFLDPDGKIGGMPAPGESSEKKKKKRRLKKLSAQKVRNLSKYEWSNARHFSWLESWLYQTSSLRRKHNNRHTTETKTTTYIEPGCVSVVVFSS
eukprot:COSAG05_NODE_3530_length_2007_cov_26.977987_1_plen_259_part_00